MSSRPSGAFTSGLSGRRVTPRACRISLRGQTENCLGGDFHPQAQQLVSLHSTIDHCNALFGVVRFCRDSLMAQHGKPKGLGR